MRDLFVEKPQPDIHIHSVRITEPMTAFTCLIITLCCAFAVYKIGNGLEMTLEKEMMRVFFICLGASNFVSAIYGHAFLYKYGMKWKIPGWIFGMLAVGAVVQTSIWRLAPYFSTNGTYLLELVNLMALLILMIYCVRRLNFKLVEVHAAFGLLAILFPIELWLNMHESDPASIWMMLALIPSVIAVVLHIVKFTPSVWFNYFDLGHLLLCVSVWCFLHATENM